MGAWVYTAHKGVARARRGLASGRTAADAVTVKTKDVIDCAGKVDGRDRRTGVVDNADKVVVTPGVVGNGRVWKCRGDRSIGVKCNQHVAPGVVQDGAGGLGA